MKRISRMIVLLCLLLSLSSDCLLVKFPNEKVEMFGHIPASFGLSEIQQPNEGKNTNQFIGLTIPQPFDGCYDENNHVNLIEKSYDHKIYQNTVLLIERGHCNFTDKILWAQTLGALGVIVMDNEARGLHYWGVVMSSESKEMNHKILIPSIFISFETGQILFNNITRDINVEVFINETGNELNIEQATWSLELTLVWFTIGGMSLFLSSLLWYICVYIFGIYEFKKRQKSIEKLSRIKYSLPIMKKKKKSNKKNKNHINENKNDIVYEDVCCSICLEDYKVSEQLVMLPCKHCFHDDCIVLWLGSKSVCCPLCKRKAIAWKQWLPTPTQQASSPDHTLTYLSSFTTPSFNSSNTEHVNYQDAEADSNGYYRGDDDLFTNFHQEIQAIPWPYKCIALVAIPFTASILIQFLVLIITYSLSP